MGRLGRRSSKRNSATASCPPSILTCRSSGCPTRRAIASRSRCPASSCRTSITAIQATSRNTATRRSEVVRKGHGRKACPSETREQLLRIEGDGCGVIAPGDFARPRASGRRSAPIRCAFLGRDAEGQTRYVGVPRGERGMLLLLSRLHRADGLRGLLLRFRQLLVLLFHRLQLAGKPLDDRLWFLVGGVGNARNVRPCERNCGDQSRCQRQSDQGGEPESAVELRGGGLSCRRVG